MKRLAACLVTLLSMGTTIVHAEVFQYRGEFRPVKVSGKSCNSTDLAIAPVVAYLDIEQGQLRQGLIVPTGPHSTYMAIRGINDLEWRLDMPYPDYPPALNHQLTLTSPLGPPGAVIEAEFIPQRDTRQDCQSDAEKLSLKLETRGTAAASAFTLARQGHEAALDSGKIFVQLAKATAEEAFALNLRRLDLLGKAYPSGHISIAYTLERLGSLAGRIPAHAAEATGYWRRAGEMAEKIAPEFAGKIWLDATNSMAGKNLEAQRSFFASAARQNIAAAAWPNRTADLKAAALRLTDHLENSADKLEQQRKEAQASEELWQAAEILRRHAPDQPLDRARLLRQSARVLSLQESLTSTQKQLALDRAAMSLALTREVAAARPDQDIRSNIAYALNTQGMVMDNTGDKARAVDAYREAIATLTPARSPGEFRSLASFRGNLAYLHADAKRYAEAGSEQSQVLSDLRSAGVAQSKAYLDALWQLAFYYQEAAIQPVAEIDARKQAVALMQVLPGYEVFNEDSLSKRVRLAERLHSVGRLQESSQVLTPLIADLRSAARQHPAERRQAYELARGLTIQASLQNDSGVPAQALQSLNEATALFDRIDGRMARKNLWAYDQQAETMISAGLPAQGIEILQQTLARKEKDPDTTRDGVLRAKIRIAQLLPSLQRWQEAVNLLREVRDEALKHYPAGEDIRARSYSALSDVLARQGPASFPEALSLQQQSCKEREAARSDSGESLSYCLLVLTARFNAMDRLGDAKLTVDRVASLLGAERKDALKGSPVTLAYLGLTYFNLGRWDDASLAFQDALDMRRTLLGPDHLMLASSWTYLGQAELSAGRSQKALAHFEEALRIRRLALGEDKALTITLASYLATSLNNTGKRAEALAMAEKALAVASRDKLSGNEMGMASYTYGNMLRQNGRQGEAITVLHQALAFLGIDGKLNNRIKTFDALSDAYWKDKQPAAAILFGKLALNASQQLRERASALEKTDQDSLREVHATAYRRIAGWMIDQGRLAEAQQVLTMLKDQEYSDFTRGGEDNRPGSAQARLTPAESPWATRYEQIQARLGRISFEIGTLQRKRDGGVQLSAAEELQWQALIKDQEIASRAFDSALLDMGKSFTDQRTRRATTERIEADGALQETLAQLSGDKRQVALVHYLVGTDQTRILVTTPDLRIARVSKLGQVEINRLVAAFRQALQNPSSDPQPLARQLYQALIQPIEADLQGAHSSMLMLSLDGTLRYLPFAALHDGKQYLIERYGLAMDTAAARDRLRETSNAAPRVWALGLTRALPGFSALAGVQRELDGIVGSDGARGKAMFDEAFTESALQQGLQQRYPVLHIASHFKFMPGSEESSFLLLGDGTHLTLDDIRHRVRFQGTDLLTLSACETGVGGGDDANGREVEGLGALAQKRGARAVLATLWPVADSSTAQLMQTMYASRSEQKLSKAEALRQAQIGLLSGTISAATPSTDPDRGARAHGSAADGKAASKGWTHPYYWAPFILMGNWL